MSTHNDPADDPFASATQLLSMLRAGEVSSVDLAERHLERIDAHDRELSTMVTVDREGALEAARRCDDERAEGTAVGALHGLPITLKDCFATAGLRTTAGKEDMADHVPAEDAVTVARLREAGAVVLAKTNLPAGVSGRGGPDGLPIGAQVVAAPHRDLTTIAFAGALSEVIGGFEAPPRFA